MTTTNIRGLQEARRSMTLMVPDMQLGRLGMSMLTLPDALLSLGVAVVAGALIGAEREQAQVGKPNPDFGGVRTFPLVALVGAFGGLLRPIFGAWLLGMSLAAVIAFLTISHARSRDEDVGISSEIAAVITFVLGAVAATPELMATGPRYLLVASIAATTMALLALKRPLHGFVSRVSIDDIYATAKFALLAAVIIPLLPNRTFGPLDVLNPFKVGLMIVLVAGVSFAGYVAVRVIGSQRGLLLVGLIGGLASSTAVTLTFAHRAKEQPELSRMCTVAILAASSTMFVRVLIVVGFVDWALLPSLVLTLGAMALGGYATIAALMRLDKKTAEKSDAVPFRNPFELKTAVQFGALYTIVIFAAKAAQVYLGSAGVIASSIFAGLTDVDAITLSLTELHHTGLDANTAIAGITFAAITNTLVKVGMSILIGGRAFGKRVGLALIGSLAAGLVMWIILAALR